MLTKPKLTILSVLIIATLIAVPLITADDFFFNEPFFNEPFFNEPEPLDDPGWNDEALEDDSWTSETELEDDSWSEGTLEDDYWSPGTLEDPIWTSDEMHSSGKTTDARDKNHDTDSEYYFYNRQTEQPNYYISGSDGEEDEFDDGFIPVSPWDDPMNFDDPADIPGDDIQDIGDDDIPIPTTPGQGTNPEPTPGPGPSGPTDYESGLSIQITGTRMQNEIKPGEQLLLKIYVKNNGKEKLDNMKIVLVNQELALRDSIGPIDLKRGERASKTLLLDFPQGIEPGYYYLRISIHADGIDRVIYRDVRVE